MQDDCLSSFRACLNPCPRSSFCAGAASSRRDRGREEIVNDKAELVTRSGGVLREFELAVAPPDRSRAPGSQRENR